MQWKLPNFEMFPNNSSWCLGEKNHINESPKVKTMFKIWFFSKGSDDMGWFSACLEILPLSFYLLSYMQSIKPYMTLKRAHWKTLISFWNRASFTGIWSWFFSWILIKKHCFFTNALAAKIRIIFRGLGLFGVVITLPQPSQPKHQIDSIEAPSRHWPLTRPHLEVSSGFRNPEQKVVWGSNALSIIVSS